MIKYDNIGETGQVTFVNDNWCGYSSFDCSNIILETRMTPQSSNPIPPDIQTSVMSMMSYQICPTHSGKYTVLTVTKITHFVRV